MKKMNLLHLAVSALALLTVLSLSASSASAHVFDDIKGSFASLTGVGNFASGFILAFIFVIVLMIVLSLVIGEANREMLVMASGFTVAFAVGVGWIDFWFIIFIGLIVIMLIVRPFSSGE